MGTGKEANGNRNGKCMNTLCRGASPPPSGWWKGWPLRSGGFASLCSDCGSAYEQSIFCEVFHSIDSGWRKCSMCGKNLHCGCAASQLQIQLLDSGGVSCIVCVGDAGNSRAGCNEKFKRHGIFGATYDNQLISERLRTHGKNHSEARGSQMFDNICLAFAPSKIKGEFDPISTSEKFCESLVKAGLDIPLCPSGTPNSFSRLTGGETTSTLLKANIPLPPANRQRHLQPKPPKLSRSPAFKGDEHVATQIRHARPPEVKGRTQLLPRYWPRITDQELQQLSGDCNAVIVPLFEKVLSASDAGRSGRLVLPKACAEAYMPPIFQPEGIPLRIQDAHENEWVFQFRFWPNNNSRMYVLEGVTPCIQSMQLQAGDTVIFSRIDPEGKLMLGCRKARNNKTKTQDRQSSSTANEIQESNRNGTLISSKRKSPQELDITIQEAQDLLISPLSAKPSIVSIEGYDFEEYDEPPILGNQSLLVAQNNG